MFKLPICPHCKAVYYYRDTVKTSKTKKSTCHSCGREFNVKKKAGFAVLSAIIFIVAIIVNLILLNTLSFFSAAALLTATIIVILIGFLFYPYFISFKK